MAQTQIEKLLTGYLATSKAAEGTQAIVYLQMKTEEQQLAMCEFLSANPETTEEQILTEARRIAKA